MCGGYLNMPSNVFDNGSNNSQNIIGASLFVQKPYLRTNFTESLIEEEIELKNQFSFKNLPDPTSTREAASNIMLIRK